MGIKEIFNRKLKITSKDVDREIEFQEILAQVASCIAMYRINEGLTQKEFGEKINFTQAMISKLESGEYNPTLKMLFQISNVTETKLQIKFEDTKKRKHLCSMEYIYSNNNNKVNSTKWRTRSNNLVLKKVMEGGNDGYKAV